jgi:phenylacetic acid degradation operon negative regulatory protein
VTILDDADSRAGSAVSLARTVVGLYLRRLGGWIAIADLVRVMEHLGVSPAQTRTAVTRLKARRLLVPEMRGRVKGYLLNDEATPMLEAGDRRIFHPRRMSNDDPWCLISFSIPEQHRDRRHQLRRRLHWIGCGTVSPALWICPAWLTAEVDAIVADLGMREHVTLFEARTAHVTGDLVDAVATWWDLGDLAATHIDFTTGATALLQDTRGALTRYVRGIDLWRPIPYLDPGLPYDLLPADWPGLRSEELYETIAGLSGDAWAQLCDLLGIDTAA